tara:strand:+ start:159 stop:356 length:198 start_codon:yes stop_codon:yes gene_type:complete
MTIKAKTDIESLKASDINDQQRGEKHKNGSEPQGLTNYKRPKKVEPSMQNALKTITRQAIGGNNP